MGQPEYSKKVFVAKSLLQNGGWISNDTVIERVENKYWKIEVADFTIWFLGFTKFVGEWETTEIEVNKILIKYTYTLHSDTAFLYPIHWLFAKTFWRLYMKKVLKNIRVLTTINAPYLYQ